MDINQLHPDLRPSFRYIPAIPFHNPVLLPLLNLLQPLQTKLAKPQPGVDISEHPLPHCKVRIYRAPGTQNSRAALLWIHGGGYIMGNAAINDRECAVIAKKLGVLVVSVDYRLAPKHPFPLPLDDCFDAWRYLQSNADKLQIDHDRIAIMGQSAGGGLAACLVQRIADAGGVQPAAQVLAYPMLDDHTAANSSLDAIKHRLWNNKNNRGGWRAYLGQPPGQQEAPRFAAAARQQDLSGLPPAWIGVGELDLFHEEDCAYADRLKAAGIYCEFFAEPGCPHAYDIIAPKTPVSQRMIHSYMAFLKANLLQN